MSIKSILREELSNNIHIVNNSELSHGIWDAKEIINKKHGKYPYLKIGFLVIPIEKGF